MSTKPQTLEEALKRANPNNIADMLKLLDVSKLFAPIKITVASLGAVAAVDITSPAVKAAITELLGIGALPDGAFLPAIGSVLSLRVTASGTAASLGTYGISDAGGTPIVPPGGAGLAMGIATLSNDGKTLTFPNTITGFVLAYTPRPAVALTQEYALGVGIGGA